MLKGSAMLPLEGVRVLDLSRLLPGPYCSLILADLGADVVRVESPNGADPLRLMPPMSGDSSAYFHGLNRNKRSITLDLKRREGVELFLKLVGAGFDVVIESFRPGVMDRLGLGYGELCKVRKQLILCSITGHGQAGPRRSKAGHDLNYVGLSGLLALTGEKGGAPAIPGAQVADIGGGSLMGAVGVLSALVRRSVSGEGAWLDVSMTEGALAFLSMQIGARKALESQPERGAGLLHGEMPCYGVYRTADDRYMTLAAIEPKFWQQFCSAIGREDLVGEGHFSGRRGMHAKGELARLFETRTQAEWVALFSGLDVCCEPVHEVDDLFEDEQHRARGSFVSVEDAPREPMAQVACPIRFLGEAPSPASAAPSLGADTDEVLSSIGVKSHDLASLRKDGVIL